MDPKEMSETELTAAVAELVMGWEKISGITAWKLNGELVHGYLNPWRPLTDWNHTFAVVAAMRAKNWRVVIDDFVGDVKFFLDTDADETNWAEARIVEGNIQRAILECALIAAKGGA